jgi:hypothetical protein
VRAFDFHRIQKSGGTTQERATLESYLWDGMISSYRTVILENGQKKKDC